MNSTFPWKNDLQLAHTRIQKEVLAKSWATTRSRRKCATIRTWHSLIDILRPFALLDLRFLHHRVTWWRVCPSEDDASLVLFSVTSLLVVLHISSLNTLHRAHMSHVQTKKTGSMLPTTEAARCFSTKTPSTVMSKSSPVTIMTPGAICLIKWWKGNRDGSYRVFCHAPHFVNHQWAGRSTLQCSPFLSATITPRRKASPRSSFLLFVPSWILRKLTWLQVISMVLHGGIAAKTTSLPRRSSRPFVLLWFLKTFDLVAGDFNGTAWRSRSWDNFSTIDEAFTDCALLTPPGPSPLWGLGSILDNRADLCGFLKPPGFSTFLESA